MLIAAHDPDDSARLAAAIRKARSAEGRDRLRVALLALEGHPTRSVMDKLGRSRGFVQRWAYAYRDGGIDALRHILPWSAGSDFVDPATNQVIFNNERTALAYTKLAELRNSGTILLGAPNSGQVAVNPKPHYQWFFAAPWIQDDWRISNRLTLNLGFRWDINGSVTEENNMLNYAFDPTIVNPVSALVGQQVMGGIRFVGVDGAPDRPWKLDKNNYQFRVGTAYSLNEKTIVRTGWGIFLMQAFYPNWGGGLSLDGFENTPAFGSIKGTSGLQRPGIPTARRGPA